MLVYIKCIKILSCINYTVERKLKKIKVLFLFDNVAILNFRADSTVSIAESVCFDFHAAEF